MASGWGKMCAWPSPFPRILPPTPQTLPLPRTTQRTAPLRLSALHERLAALGAKLRHEERLLRGWLQACGYDTPRRPASDFFPLALREALPSIETELATLARLDSEHPAGAGVARLLVGLHDGQLAESVLLPRGGLCVSSQVGCAVGCTFCMSGRAGLVRQLGSLEIAAQVALARRMRAVSKVVFMGMGEPAHNLDNVLEAIQLLGLQGNIAHKNLVLSTVGDPRVFERLPQAAVKPALAVSLHSTDDALRAELLPRAPRIPVAELVAQAEAYARATHHPTQYQWTLLDGINDHDAEIERIAQLLQGKYAVLNFIPFNEVKGLAYRRPAREHIAGITRRLNQRGIYTRIRDSAGQEVEGACGQLRARALQHA